MMQLSWLFFGVLAASASAGAISGGLPRYISQILAAVSVILWGYWGWNATNVEVISSGVTQVAAYDGAMYIGLIAAAIMFLLLVESIFGWFGLVDERGGMNATQ